MRALLLLFFAFALGAQTRLETGEIEGAKFRIDIPPNWNHGLVMYCHGYSPAPGHFNEKPASDIFAGFLTAGYAVAQSGYSSGGWAVQDAVQNTEALRRYFVAKYGPVKETFVTGHSMGGLLTMLIMERFPATYKGGLALCGPLTDMSSFLLDAFNSRVVFDYYYPGILPAPDNVPPDFRNSKQLVQRVVDALKQKPAEAEMLRRYTRLHSLDDIAGGLALFTELLGDLRRRGGGNAFDNRNVVYTIEGDSNALNRGVKRYAADPVAAAYVGAWYSPTGKLDAPMLAIHTTYDPIVPSSAPDTYATRARAAGNPGLFVQQYVEHDGHCAIRPEEISSGFSELLRWVETGSAPGSGLVPVSSSQTR
jgi:alpha-beta hydrolase superfamily lysophospholipase